MHSSFGKFLSCAAFLAFFFYAAIIDSDELGKWPVEDGVTNELGLCTVHSYRDCAEGDWLGVRERSLPELVDKSGKAVGRHIGILKELCMYWDESSVDSDFWTRFVENEFGDELILCRLKPQSEIDRGSVLAELEIMDH